MPLRLSLTGFGSSKNTFTSSGSVSDLMTYELIAICPYIYNLLIFALEWVLSCCGYQVVVIWHALDKHEGPTGNNPSYDRVPIQGHTDCGNRDVTTYLARRGRIDESLKPYTWYLELIHCGAEQHGLPEDYRRKIENIVDIPDPDENRREKRKAEGQMQEYLSLRKLPIKDIT